MPSAQGLSEHWSMDSEKLCCASFVLYISLSLLLLLYSFISCPIKLSLSHPMSPWLHWLGRARKWLSGVLPAGLNKNRWTIHQNFLHKSASPSIWSLFFIILTNISVPPCFSRYSFLILSLLLSLYYILLFLIFYPINLSLSQSVCFTLFFFFFCFPYYLSHPTAGDWVNNCVMLSCLLAKPHLLWSVSCQLLQIWNIPF